MRSRTDSKEPVDDSVEMDPDDSVDMRVPSTNDSNDVAADTNKRNDSSDDTNKRNDSGDVSDGSDESESPLPLMFRSKNRSQVVIRLRVPILRLWCDGLIGTGNQLISMVWFVLDF